jgi:hypothetical protein
MKSYIKTQKFSGYIFSEEAIKKKMNGKRNIISVFRYPEEVPDEEICNKIVDFIPAGSNEYYDMKPKSYEKLNTGMPSAKESFSSLCRTLNLKPGTYTLTGKK